MPSEDEEISDDHTATVNEDDDEQPDDANSKKETSFSYSKALFTGNARTTFPKTLQSLLPTFSNPIRPGGGGL